MKKVLTSVLLLFLTILYVSPHIYASSTQILLEFDGSETIHSMIDYDLDYSLWIEDELIIDDGVYIEESSWALIYHNELGRVFKVEKKTQRGFYIQMHAYNSTQPFVIENPIGFAFDIEYISIAIEPGQPKNVFKPYEDSFHNQSLNTSSITIWANEEKIFENGLSLFSNIIYSEHTGYFKLYFNASSTEVRFYYNTEINAIENRGRLDNDSPYQITIAESFVIPDKVVQHDIQFYDDDELTHTLNITDLNDYTIYADGYLIFNRGMKIGNLYDITYIDGDLVIADTNEQLISFLIDDSIDWDITTIERLIFIQSNEAITSIVITPGMSDHRLTSGFLESYTTIYQDEAIIYNGYSYDPSIYIHTMLDENSLFLTVGNEFPRERVELYVTPPSIIYKKLKTTLNTTQFKPLESEIVAISAIPTNLLNFNNIQIDGDDFEIIMNGDEVTIYGDLIASQQVNILSYLPILEDGKHYKITYEHVNGSLTSGTFNPFSINNSDSFMRNASNIYQTRYTSFLFTNESQIKMNFEDALIGEYHGELRYRLILEDVTVHTVSFDQTSQLSYQSSRIALMSNTKKLALARELEALDPQDVIHYDYASDPTAAVEEETNNDIIVGGYYDKETGLPFDFNEPVVEDVTVVPLLFQNNLKTITYKFDNGSSESVVYYPYGESVPQPQSPTKPGYTFDGWYVKPDIPLMIDTPITELNNHSLREVFEEGNLITSQLLTFYTGGTDVTNLTGYTFEFTYGSSFYFPVNPATGSATFNLNFTSHTGSFTSLTYYNYSGDDYTSLGRGDAGMSYGSTDVWDEYNEWSNLNYDTLVITGGVDATNPEVIAWFQANGTLTPPTPPASDVTFTTSVDGLTVPTQMINYGELATLPVVEDHMIEGVLKTVTGWTLNGEPFSFNTPITEDITLVAVWETVIEEDEIVIDESFVLYDFNQPLTDDIYLVAKWIENPPGTYTVTFDSEFGSYVPPANVVDGQTVMRPADPYRPGYEFSHWAYIDHDNVWDFETDVITEDITLRAIYTWLVPEPPIENEILNHFASNWVYYMIGILLLGAMFGFGLKKPYKKRGRTRW